MPWHQGELQATQEFCWAMKFNLGRHGLEGLDVLPGAEG